MSNSQIRIIKYKLFLLRNFSPFDVSILLKFKFNWTSMSIKNGHATKSSKKVSEFTKMSFKFFNGFEKQVYILPFLLLLLLVNFV